MYKITFLPDAEESFKKLDKPIQKRIAQKIDWLAENADKVIHHTLTSLLPFLHRKRSIPEYLGYGERFSPEKPWR